MVSNLLCMSEGFSRLIEWEINGRQLMTPTYFPSISSFGIKYSFKSLIELFLYYKYPRVLISAYDIFFLQKNNQSQICQKIKELKDSFIFLDSGVFESFWKDNNDWSYGCYKKVISLVQFDLYTSFDLSSKDKTKEVFQESLQKILDSSILNDEAAFLPILHGNPKELVNQIENMVNKFPDLCCSLAIPERDCGANIFEKAQTISKIRKILDVGKKDNQGRILHILGCGDPKSILLYSYAGANSFDSLDWIKYSIDSDQLQFNNFSYLDLMNCECPVCTGSKKNYVERVLLHNLLFYQEYMLKLQSLIKTNSINLLLKKHFNDEFLVKVLAT